MSVPGKGFDCQSAGRDPDELHNTSNSLATSSGLLRREGIEKSGSEEPLAINTFTLLSGGGARGKESRRQKLSYVYDKPCAAGIVTCTQSGMTIPSYLSSEMNLGNFPDHTEFQSWIVNFRTEVCSKAKKSHACVAVDEGNRSSQIAG